VAGPARTRRRSPGRHLLGSRALAADLVARARVDPGDLAVDIGAGTGLLTRELARTADEVWAVEADAGLAAGLRHRFRDANVRVLEGDARSLSWPREPFKVVANLPFGGSGAILRRLLDDPGTPLVTADVVVQWEAACKRAAVWPSTLLGVYWGAWYDVRVIRRLAASAFTPAPAVDGGVLRIERRGRPLVRANAEAAYRAFLEDGFRAHGAPLRRALRRHATALQLKRLGRELGFSPDARAHDLDAWTWASVFARFVDDVRLSR
jgi:23S rRNA (adenine-N6)-dimethyltransferase